MLACECPNIHASIRQPSAQPPLGSVQLFTKPFWQKKHSPQKVSTLTVTRSPALTLRTSAPTSSTMPTISWPTVIPGTARGTLPCLMCRSLVQILPSVMRTMASRGLCNLGFGFSTKANFPFSMYVYANIIVYYIINRKGSLLTSHKRPKPLLQFRHLYQRFSHEIMHYG